MASRVELRVLGWPEDCPRLDLDHERFAYAGNFRTGRKGIAVALGDEPGESLSDATGHNDAVADPATDDAANEDDQTNAVADPATDEAADEAGQTDAVDDAATVDGRSVVAAVSFDDDRAAADALRIRYVTVREDRRGEGIGPELLAFVVERARDRGFERVRIGVNNPIAYRACYRAGFGFTGEASGMGELVLEVPPPADRSAERYRDGLERFAGRDLPERQRRVLERHRDGEPPEPGRR